MGAPRRWAAMTEFVADAGPDRSGWLGVTVLVGLAGQRDRLGQGREFTLALRARCLMGLERDVNRLAQCQQGQVVLAVEFEARIVRIQIVRISG